MARPEYTPTPNIIISPPEEEDKHLASESDTSSLSSSTIVGAPLPHVLITREDLEDLHNRYADADSIAEGECEAYYGRYATGGLYALVSTRVMDDECRRAAAEAGARVFFGEVVFELVLAVTFLIALWFINSIVTAAQKGR